MKAALRDNGLGLVFGLAFLITLVAQAFVGHAAFNDQQVTDGAEPVSLGEYVTSSSFATDVAENWQSEYLQFFLYAFGTVWLVQRGSPESKEPTTSGASRTRSRRSARTPRPTRRRGRGPAVGGPRCSPALSDS